MPQYVEAKKFPQQSLGKFNISSFRGIDLSSAPNNVDKTRSPDAQNMIADSNGFPVKRQGYELAEEYPARINGVFELKTPTMTKRIVHAGTVLYTNEESADSGVNRVTLYTNMKDDYSTAWQVGGKLWIVDGNQLLCYDGQTVKSASEGAYIPTLTISRSPTGGGESYEPLNLLQSKWTDSFLGVAQVKDYQLSFDGLNNTAVAAQKLNSSGDWVDMVENTDFTVNRTTGKVTFTTAPGASPITGQDNVKITAARTLTEYQNRIHHCTISILYGVNGASDRLFVSGNPDYPNYDWYSQRNDPSYFGDLWYSVLGQDNSAIVGYSIISDRLAAHKDNAENGRNVIVRSGTLLDGQAAFPIATALQGEGAIGKRTFAYFASEPLFLTRLGVYAVTAQDITGEKYAQNRSFYINGALTNEPNLEHAYGFVYKDLYLLAINNKVYILDSKQRSYERDAPYATFQYECYLWTNIPARIFWEEDGTLYFGTADGKAMRFKTDTETLTSYNDNGAAIEAYWTIPDFSGKEFYKNKTVKYIAIKVAPHVRTSFDIWVQKKGVWSLLFSESAKTRYFSWEQLCWSKFTWSSDQTPKTIGKKIKLKKIDKVAFRIVNDTMDEPFGIYEVSLEFTESGNYKG